MQQEIKEERVLPAPGAGEEVQEIELNGLGDSRLNGNEKPDLDGEEVTIRRVSLIPKDEELKSKDNVHTYRTVLLKLTYSNGAFEHYGGMRQFKEEDGTWSEPTFWVGGRSATAQLFRAWIDKTEKAPNEVSLKEFLTSLVGMKAVLRGETVVYAGQEYHKNVVDQFV